MEKIFNIVANRVESSLNNNGFKKAIQENKTSALFLSENTAYLVNFNLENKQFELKICNVTDGTPDENWKNISSWLFDPDVNTQKDAENIASDFVQSLSSSKKTAALPVAKKRKDNDNQVDIIFFMNRLVTIFPELKIEIKEEQEQYGTFRMVNFTEQKVLPKIQLLFAREPGSKQFKKLCNILSDAYKVGDLDVRSTVTVLILDNITNENQIAKIKENISDDLKKAWNSSLKFKDKNIKPEKIKKKKKNFIANTLANK